MAESLFDKSFLLWPAAKLRGFVLRVRLLSVPGGTLAGPHLCVLATQFLARSRYGTIYQTGSEASGTSRAYFAVVQNLRNLNA